MAPEPKVYSPRVKDPATGLYPEATESTPPTAVILPQRSLSLSVRLSVCMPVCLSPL
jgi:hypothetical protein